VISAADARGLTRETVGASPQAERRGVTSDRASGGEITMEALDHVRGGPGGRLVVEYGDHECPYSRRAFREIERVEARVGDGVRFAFRHFPLTEIHPHALAASRTRSGSSSKLGTPGMKEAATRRRRGRARRPSQPARRPGHEGHGYHDRQHREHVLHGSAVPRPTRQGRPWGIATSPALGDS